MKDDVMLTRKESEEIDELCGEECKHGGTCTLPEDHAGSHNSGYCIWTDKEYLAFLRRENP